MTARWLAIAALASACDAGRPKSQPAESPRPPRAPAPVTAGEVALGRDDTFRAAILRYEQRTHRKVQRWGTIPLDGEHPIRFAILDGPPRGRGAYVFELAAGRAVELTFQEDTWSGADPPADGGAVSWTIAADRTLEHETHHPTGWEKVVFGLRGDKLVAFSDEDIQDIYKPELNVHETYAKHGRCGADCPVVDYELYGNDAEFSQSEVAPSVDALVEPYRYHFE